MSEKNGNIENEREQWEGSYSAQSRPKEGAVRSHGVKGHSTIRIVKIKKNAQPVLTLKLDKTSFVCGFAEEAILEVLSLENVEDVIISFDGVETENARLDKVSGRALIPVRFRFTEAGDRTIKARVNYKYQNTTLTREFNITVSVAESPSADLSSLTTRNTSFCVLLDLVAPQTSMRP